MSAHITLKSVKIWAIFFYVIFLIQVLAIQYVDMEHFGVVDKWQFVNPTYVSWVFIFYSLAGFMTAYFFMLFFAQDKASINKFYSYSIKPFYCKGSRNAIIFFIFAMILYGYYSSVNYRLDGGPIDKLVMNSLSTLVYSMILVLILVRKNFYNRKPSNLILILALLTLSSQITGMGSLIVLVSLVLIAILSDRKIFFRHIIIYGMLAILILLGMIIFLLNWKYGYELNSIDSNRIYTTVEWVFQRLLTVPGSSVFLIENYQNTSPVFGFEGAYEVFYKNFIKLIGGYSAEYRYSSLGQYNFELFYIGKSIDSPGLSPGIIGGALFFFPWFFAAFFSGILLFLILFIVSMNWSIFLVNQSIFVNFLFYYSTLNFFLLNPYSWLSIIDPGFVKFFVFLFTPYLLSLFCRLTWGEGEKNN